MSLWTWLMTGERETKEKYNLTGSYLDRLRFIVGAPLPKFPSDVQRWREEQTKPPSQLAKEYGITMEKAYVLQQTLWLIHEVAFGNGIHRTQQAPTTAAGWHRIPEVEALEDLPQEHLVMFVVNRDGHYSDHLLAIGSETRCPVPKVEQVANIYREMEGAYFILVHNHPSGVPTPSDDDIEVTEYLRRYAAEHGMNFHDHLIVAARGAWHSMKQGGFFGS